MRNSLLSLFILVNIFVAEDYYKDQFTRIHFVSGPAGFKNDENSIMRSDLTWTLGFELCEENTNYEPITQHIKNFKCPKCNDIVFH